MADSYVPRKGDLAWLSFSPHAGHEQAGRRPSLVLSPSAYNRAVGLALFCPITSQVKGYPFEVLVPTGLGIEGVIVADQVRNLDWRIHRVEFLARLPDFAVAQVLSILTALLSRSEAQRH